MTFPQRRYTSQAYRHRWAPDPDLIELLEERITNIRVALTRANGEIQRDQLEQFPLYVAEF